jgi:hypothetical protein
MQHLAASILPVLERATKRKQFEEAVSAFKQHEAQFYKDNKEASDAWFEQLAKTNGLTVPAKEGNNPSAYVPEYSIPADPVARTRVLAQGQSIPGVADLSRRMLLEQLIEEPKKAEAARIRSEDREDRQSAIKAAQDQADATKRQLAADRLQAEKERSEETNALRRDLAGIAAGSRREALTAAAEKAEAKANAAATAKQADSQEMVNLLGTARELVPKATSSGLGTARDAVLGVFGQSTDAADAASRLKTIGGMLVSKVPRMQGPQSDKDLALYREMAGRVGDSSVPVSQRLAAIDTLEELHRRYAGLAPVVSPRGSSGVVGGSVKRFNPATGRLE